MGGKYKAFEVMTILGVILAFIQFKMDDENKYKKVIDAILEVLLSTEFLLVLWNII